MIDKSLVQLLTMSDPGNATSRFTCQATSAEELLKTQTVGLVQLDDYRKRRRDVQDIGAGSGYGLSEGMVGSS